MQKRAFLRLAPADAPACDRTSLSAILRRSRLGAAAFALVLGALPALAQSGTPPGAAAAHKSCPVVHTYTPNSADQAFAGRHFVEAEALYAALPASSAATAGVVRSQLAERKLDEALRTVQKALAEHPNDALLLDVLGEVRYRRGDIAEAAKAFNLSLQMDLCLARAHYDVYRYLMLAGEQASAQGQLETAHGLAPADPLITPAYERSQRVPPTEEEELARVRSLADEPGIPEERKAALQATVKALEARQRGDCRLANPVSSTKVPLTPLDNTTMLTTHGAGLDIFLNGHRRRLMLDSGASGIVLTHAAAKALGLEEEAETRSQGLGDEGARTAFVSHVDDLKVGTMEFHNCMVHVFEDKRVLNGTDGLIGADVFRSFLITLDFPQGEMRLSPLPKRPNEAETVASLGSNGDVEPEVAGRTLASLRRDRYVAPEMKDWTPVFRYGHELIVPTSIGTAPLKLFLLDTGSSHDLISPEAAGEVTGVDRNSPLRLHGISGEVKDVRSTGAVTLTFARVRAPSLGLISIDTSHLVPGSGIELSGLIGFQTLRELVMQIDYRDNLVHMQYIPHIE